MTKAEHTHGYSVADYTRELEHYLGGAVDTIIYSNKVPPEDVLKRYARESDSLISWDDLPSGHELVGANLLTGRMAQVAGKIGTPASESSLVRHDPARLAAAIAKAIGVTKNA